VQLPLPVPSKLWRHKPCKPLGTMVTDHALNSNGPRRVGNRLAPHETGKADKESGDLVTRKPNDLNLRIDVATRN
jgi:hypothetical protein